MPSPSNAPPPSPAHVSFLEMAFPRPARAEARARLHERIVAWTVATAARLRAVGYDGGPDAVRSDADSDRVVLMRSDNPRRATGAEPDKPPARACIALSVTASEVEVAVELPPAEVGAARMRLADPVRALELATALQTLPEQFTMGVGGRAEERNEPVCRAT